MLSPSLPFISHHWLSVRPLNPQAAGGPAFSCAQRLPSCLAEQLLQDPQAFKSVQYIRWNTKLLPRAWKRCYFARPPPSPGISSFSLLFLNRDFQGSAQSCASSRKSSQNALKSNLLEKTWCKAFLGDPATYILSLCGIFLWHFMIFFQHLYILLCIIYIYI